MNAVLLEGIVKRIGRFTLAIDRLAVPAGSITAVVGHNGAGKSTLLSLLALLDTPDSGTVSIFGAAEKGGGKRLAQRRGISLLLQEAVMLSLSVRDNVAYGLRLRGMADDAVARRVAAVIEEMALTPLADRRATELSGGEARRVAFARAIAVPAKLYLFDEPATGADARSAELIEEAIRRLAREGNTLLFAAHDGMQREKLADRTVILEEGRIAG